MMPRFMSLKKWLVRENSRSSAPRKRASARPRLESLEVRDVPSSFTFLPVNTGYTSPGHFYRAGTQEVVFFAEEVQGSLTSANAQSAWSQGANIVTKSVQTLVKGNDILDRTTSQHFMLIGWDNINTHSGGWLAAKYDGNFYTLATGGPWYNQYTYTVTHSTMDWMSNDGQGRHNVEGPLTLTYTTNGYHVGLYVSPDSSGNIHANFNTPS
jgi:hypothetical protein